jgi:hypothetical protein
MAKCRAVRPAVDKILAIGNISMQAAVLRAIVDHSSLASACHLAGINSSKHQAATNFVCQQSARMMERKCTFNEKCGKSTDDQRNAAEVLLTFGAPSPEKTSDIPSVCERA